MQLINIEDNKTEKDDNNGYAIGIDLGTTNSLVAYSINQEPKILHEKDQPPEIKSLINVSDEGMITVGESDSTNITTLRSIKRLMGKSLNDLDENLKNYQYSYAETGDSNRIIELSAGNIKITPVEAQAEILKTLKRRAEKLLEQKIDKAVITVPAYFDDASRQATKDAAQLAGLEVLRLLNEPTAAALSYGLDNKTEGYYAIYDFGGGTFDVSILKMTKGIFQTVATKGDNILGGDDIDIAISDYLKASYRIATNSPYENKYLLEIAKSAKEYLCSHNKEYSSTISINNSNYEISLNISEFEKIIKPIIDKTINIFDQTIKDANISTSEIAEIILVGGSTKTPYLKTLLESHLGKAPLDTVNPDTVVAIGAAIQAENLTSGGGNLLLDIIPLSLGIETMGEVVEKIIPRNSTLPISVAQEFTTYKDNQTGFKIHIVQGERELASQNRSLAFFELRNIPPLPAGQARIKINFNIDTDGILTVTATEQTTKITQEVQVKPSYGLTTDEMQKMLYDSYNNAKSDMLKRMLNKNYTDIEQFIDVISKMKDDKSFNLSNETKKQIILLCKDSMNNAKDYLHNDKLKELDELQKSLKQYINDLCIEKVSNITDSLKGKDIKDVDNILNN